MAYASIALFFLPQRPMALYSHSGSAAEHWLQLGVRCGVLCIAQGRFGAWTGINPANFQSGVDHHCTTAAPTCHFRQRFCASIEVNFCRCVKIWNWFSLTREKITCCTFQMLLTIVLYKDEQNIFNRI